MYLPVCLLSFLHPSFLFHWLDWLISCHSNYSHFFIQHCSTSNSAKGLKSLLIYLELVFAVFAVFAVERCLAVCSCAAVICHPVRAVLPRPPRYPTSPFQPKATCRARERRESSQGYFKPSARSCPGTLCGVLCTQAASGHWS